ncbi:MAG: hypothetical protein JJE52_10590 [Acidimicrobiia bacterium]|nr:hypothetical protein [Acidimicrobiia bacterium]
MPFGTLRHRVLICTSAPGERHIARQLRSVFSARDVASDETLLRVKPDNRPVRSALGECVTAVSPRG